MPLFQAAARLCLYQAIKALDPVGNCFLLPITANCQKDTQRLQPLLLATHDRATHRRPTIHLWRSFRANAARFQAMSRFGRSFDAPFGETVDARWSGI